MTSKGLYLTRRRNGPHSSSWPSSVILVLGVIAGMLANANFVNAQTTGLGTISGAVTDTSGAMVPQAKVKITNLATGVSRDSVTNGTGYYEVGALIPGKYKILVSKPGFKDLLREGITLEADARVSVPMQVAVGRSVQTVIVQADASLLNTESGSSGQVLTTRQVEALPVSGNNPTWLALIAPGVHGTTGQ